MTFTIMFWNIWLENQIQGHTKSSKLLGELKRVIQKYEPDYIGLNEVLQKVGSKAPFVSDFLSDEEGYTHSYFAPASPFTEDWLIGAGLYSRKKFKSVSSIVISQDTPAERRGFSGHTLKAIAATVNIAKDSNINIIVAHPMHLRFYTIRDHYAGTASLERIVRSNAYSSNTILGGDFNEPGFMPKAFKNTVEDIMFMKTGTRWATTWRYDAHPMTPIRANLDQIYWTKNSVFKLESFEVVHSNVSDHRPILARFSYK